MTASKPGQVLAGASPSPSNFRRVAWVRLGALVVVVAIVALVAAIAGPDSLQRLLDVAASSGWRGAVLFVLLYAAGTVAMMPGSAATVTAGLVYGTVAGAVVAVIGATLGGTIAYGIARGVGRKPVQELLDTKGASIDGWIADRQFRSIVLLRLLPILPFNLVNYAAGLSPVRPWPYVAGTFIGIVPGALVFASLGSSARQPLSAAFLVAVGALIVMVVGSGLIARRWKQSDA